MPYTVLSREAAIGSLQSGRDLFMVFIQFISRKRKTVSCSRDNFRDAVCIFENMKLHVQCTCHCLVGDLRLSIFYPQEVLKGMVVQYYWNRASQKKNLLKMFLALGNVIQVVPKCL